MESGHKVRVCRKGSQLSVHYTSPEPEATGPETGTRHFRGKRGKQPVTNDDAEVPSLG